MSWLRYQDPTHVVVAAPLNYTANAVLTAAQADALIGNVGAAGAVVLTLPAASVGLNFGLMVCVAQTLEFISIGGDLIFWLDTVPAGGTHVYSNQLYSVLWLSCIEGGKWVVSQQPLGTWSIG